MYKNRKIGVVVPAYNEEKLIGNVIENMPDFVDKIIVVDDLSRDRTIEKVESYIQNMQQKLILLKSQKNQGCGGALIMGYKWAMQNNIDIVVRMDGDSQMDPNELHNLLDAVVGNNADYVKGNRLFSGQVWHIMPKYRYLGNAFLSLFTKIASGYWHIADSQSGYTAITLDTLKRLNLDKIYKRYGMPNDILVHLNVINAKVLDIPVSPIYNIGEKSGIRLRKIIPALSFLLLRRFFWRLKEKYIIRDFHPLVFFYAIAIFLIMVDIPLIVRMLFYWVETGKIPPINMLSIVFITVMSIQFLLFAMWFDMEYNKELKCN